MNVGRDPKRTLRNLRFPTEKLAGEDAIQNEKRQRPVEDGWGEGSRVGQSGNEEEG